MCNGRLHLPGRAVEQLVETIIRHGKPGRIVEVAHVQPKCTVLLDIHELIQNSIAKAGLTIWREPHELVFARVDLEPGEVGEGRVEHAQGVREVDLPLGCQHVRLTQPNRRRGPFAHAVHAQYPCALIRAGKECRCGVRLVVFGEHQWRQ